MGRLVAVQAMMAFMTITMHTAFERPDLWERGIPSEPCFCHIQRPC
jgi:hypothetical protein